MKKLGLLAVTLVLALGALGIGYAKWSDTVTINGKVSTGSVVVGIRDVSGDDILADPGPTPFHADPRVVPHDPGTLFDWVRDANGEVLFDKDVAYTNSINGEPKCMCGTTQYYASVHEDFHNVYPFYAVNQDLRLVNCGTVPIKIDSWVLTNIVDPKGILECIQWQWTINDIFHFGTLDQLVADLDHYQIEPCQELQIFFAPIFLECSPQGANLSFDIVVTGAQWNEVFTTTPPPPSSPS